MEHIPRLPYPAETALFPVFRHPYPWQANDHAERTISSRAMESRSQSDPGTRLHLPPHCHDQS